MPPEVPEPLETLWHKKMAFGRRLNWFRKAGWPWHPGSTLLLVQDSPPWTIDSSMRFKDINESGSVNRTEKGSMLFRFHYVNDFYGSCTFMARVVEPKNLPLKLENDSISLETYQIKRGTLPLLLNISKTFFRRMLGKYTSLSQLR
jgi:hypothetical protein